MQNMKCATLSLGKQKPASLSSKAFKSNRQENFSKENSLLAKSLSACGLKPSS